MNSPMSAKSTIPGSRSSMSRWGMPRNAPARRMLSRPDRSGVEAGAERQQARDVADDVDGALVRLDDPGEDLEQRALAGAVRPDDGEALAVDDPERDVAEGPEVGRALVPLQEVLERVADRRLAGQAEVVADAEAARRRSRSPASGRRCGARSQDLRERGLDPLEEERRDGEEDGETTSRTTRARTSSASSRRR